MKKSFISILTIIFCILLSSVTFAQTPSFQDVEESDWFYKDIMTLQEKQFVNGVTHSEFMPYKNITRAEFVTIIANISQADLTQYSGDTLFSDVKTNNWYSKQLQWAYENNLIQGTTTDKFAPEENITKEEAAVILYRHKQVFGGIDTTGDQNTGEFDDQSLISFWAKDAIQELKKFNIIQGFNNLFFPQNKLLRCEAASLLSKYINTIPIPENGNSSTISGDKIIFKENLITDEKELYSLAKAKGYKVSHSSVDNEFTCIATLIEKKSNIHLMTPNEIELPTSSYTQHYMTIEKENGTIEDYYTVDFFSEILEDPSTNNCFVTPSYVESENIIVTPGEGKYDNSRSARGWSKICYVIGRTGNNTMTPIYVKAIYYKGTIQRLDSKVSLSYRRLWYRNKGTCAFNNGSQNITNGPVYAAAGSETILQYAPSNFQALEYNYHELVCTTQTELKKGTSTWYLDVTISKTNYQ